MCPDGEQSFVRYAKQVLIWWGLNLILDLSSPYCKRISLIFKLYGKIRNIDISHLDIP